METAVCIHDSAMYCMIYRQPCRIRYKFTEDGEKVRISRRSGMIVPKPPELKERRDLPSRSAYIGGQAY